MQRTLILAALLTLALATPARAEEATFLKARDGDSFLVEVNNVRTDLRLIGVDCPEHGQPGAEEAKAFAVAWFLNAGGPVILEFDKARYDPFDRLLAYAWSKNGEMLNEEIIQAGLCKPKYYKPNGKHRARLETR